MKAGTLLSMLLLVPRLSLNPPVLGRTINGCGVYVFSRPKRGGVFADGCLLFVVVIERATAVQIESLRLGTTTVDQALSYCARWVVLPTSCVVRGRHVILDRKSAIFSNVLVM